MRFLALILLLTFLQVCSAQDRLRVFGGGNITNVVYHLIDNNTGIDSSGPRENYILLPLLGIDMDFDLSNQFIITTGLGVSWQGSNNFKVSPPSPDINIDSDLNMGFLRIPILLNYAFNEKFKLLLGYSFQYNFRKNQGFFGQGPNYEHVSFAKPFHHAALFGARFDINKWSFCANYQLGLSRIFDSKDFDPNKRAYLTLGGIQLTAGYLLTN